MTGLMRAIDRNKHEGPMWCPNGGEISVSNCNNWIATVIDSVAHALNNAHHELEQAQTAQRQQYDIASGVHGFHLTYLLSLSLLIF